MHPADPAPAFSRPMGAASAYGSVIRQTETPREIEYRVLAQVTAQLEAAALPGAGPPALPRALHDNRMAWMSFATDLADPGNAWDDQAKAGLLSLAIWSLNESDRVLREGKSPDALIEINRTIMLGLRPDVRTQPEPAT